MKLGREGGKSLPAQAGQDMAKALQKGIETLAAKHGKSLAETQPPQSSESAPAAQAAWEAAKANYKSPSQKSISQETFDEVVQENIEDFEMELEEAILDACQQFVKQGVNLNNIIKTTAHFNLKNKDVSDHPVTVTLVKLQEAVLAKNSSPAALAPLCKAMENIIAKCDTDEEFVPIANSKDVIGSCVTLLRTFATSSSVVPALKLIHKLCTTHHAMEQFNQFGLGPDVVLECLRKRRETAKALSVAIPIPEVEEQPSKDASIAEGTTIVDREAPNLPTFDQFQIDIILGGLAIVKLTALQHNGCKDQFYGRGAPALLNQIATEYANNVDVVKQVALTFRSIVRGDGTIDSKAPAYLKQLVEDGWLEKLTKLMLMHLRREDQNVEGAAACAFALEAIAVNEKACTQVAEFGTIKAVLQTLTHPICITNVIFARRAAALLGALARSDKNKELIAEGVPTFSECMIKNAKDYGVQKSFLGTLTAICLRQPAIAEAIVRAKGHHLAVSAMRIHPQHASLQRAACMLLRNLGSRSEHAKREIVEVGAEKFIRVARQAHALCEDVAYAALRDLGFEIEGMRTYKFDRPMHGMFTDS